MSIQLTPSSRARWIAAIDSLVVLRAPAELPAAAADRPGAEADAGDLEAGVAELCGLELCLVHGGSFRWRWVVGCEVGACGRRPSSAGVAARIPSASSAGEHEQAHPRGGDLGQRAEADHRAGEPEVGGEEQAGERLGAVLVGRRSRRPSRSRP